MFFETHSNLSKDGHNPYQKNQNWKLSQIQDSMIRIQSLFWSLKNRYTTCVTWIFWWYVSRMARATYKRGRKHLCHIDRIAKFGMQYYAGRTIKFACRKNLSIFRTVLRIRILRIFFEWCLWSGFKNPPYIWAALFEKETCKEKPLRLKCSEMWRIKEKSAEISFVHFTRLGPTGFTLKKYFSIRILREFGKSRDFFCEQIWSCDRR